MIALLGSLTYGIIEGTGAGWGSPLIVGCFVVAAAAIAALARYERRRFDPLIDVRFFRSVPFSGATVIAVCGFAALGGFLFLNTLYLQNTRGLSALGAGLYMVPMAVMCLVFAPLSGRLVGARGPRLPLVLAGITMTASGVLFAGFDAETDNVKLFTAYVLFGIGFGLINAPITNTAVSGMPRAQSGVAAAVASTSRQVGQALGVAVLGAALAAGLHAGAWWIITGCGAAVLLLGILTTGRWARGTAERTASELMAPESEKDKVAVSTS